MLSTEKGISLIVLLIAITLTSLLGVGVVSFMGAKQKTLVSQAQTYQAYAIAHAGIEFAVRYAYDNREDNDFPNSHFPKTISFGGGSFTIAYDGANNLVRSTGRYETASRTIELTNFRSYANIP
jgi:type II secretory pathway component PulK